MRKFQYSFYFILFSHFLKDTDEGRLHGVKMYELFIIDTMKVKKYYLVASDKFLVIRLAIIYPGQRVENESIVDLKICKWSPFSDCLNGLLWILFEISINPSHIFHSVATISTVIT